MAIQIDSARCTGCTSCVDVCSLDAMAMADGVAVADAESCVECGACVEVCPVEAISFA